VLGARAMIDRSRSFALIGFAPRRCQLRLCPSESIAPTVQRPGTKQLEIGATAPTRLRR